MKTITFIILALTLLGSTLAIGKDESKHRPYKWSPVSTRTDGGKIYIDIGSVDTKKTSDGKKLNLVSMLTSYDKEITVQTSNGKDLTGSSFITFVVVDCEVGAAAPMHDFFLKEKMPTIDSVPIADKKYPPSSDLVVKLDKSTPLYDSMCPAEI